jgi:hypothetical protein
MPKDAFEFWWDVFGTYRLEKRKGLSYLACGDGHSRGIGKARRYAPLREQAGLFRTFADLPENPNAILEFATKFGHLGGHGAREPITFWVDEIRSMHASIKPKHMKAVEAMVNARLNGVRVGVVQDESTDRLQLRFRPQNLLEAMWLQFAGSLGTDLDLFRCSRESCGHWFERAPQAKRRTAVYCSPACRNKAWRGRKSDG